MSQQKVILIGGPTASGKSAMALDLAREADGTIINADAMQIYDGLPILTAQPTEKERKKIPHELYGALDPAEASSAGKWLILARDAIGKALARDRTPILVGGTGLYFRALLGGLADIPPIPDEVRAETQNLYDQIGEEKFREKLSVLDPDSARRLARNDRQRLVRAYEVVTHTGKTLGEWHKKRPGIRDQGSESFPFQQNQMTQRGKVPLPFLREGLGVGQDVGSLSRNWKHHEGKQTPCPPPAPPASGRDALIEPHLLLPPRDELYAACDKRFAAMMEHGAVDEVRKFLKRNLDPALPAMKTIGVREIAAYLRGETTLDQAVAKAQQATRNYAKRQVTWFRNQKFGESLR